jgi:MFS family permease
MGWIEDTGAKGQDYALTSTFMWAGLIVGEPFAGQLARRFSMKAVLSIAMFIWSALLLGMGFSLNVIPVFAIRFLLGASEAVFGPILLTSESIPGQS